MPFQHAGLLKDAFRCPSKPSKVHCKYNPRQPPCSRRPAAHPQGNAVLHANRQGNSSLAILFQQSLVKVKDQVVFEARTPLSVAAGRLNRELRSRLRLNLKIKIQGHCDSIETRTKVGRGSRQPQPNWRSLQGRRTVHPALPFIAANTALAVASTTCALRRNPSISVSSPALS